jgi:hypothetical protein
MPQKIMASPTNIFSFYNSFTYAVINMTPKEKDPSRAVLAYVHLKNRSLVTEFDDFEPFHFQVQGPDEKQDIGFDMMDDSSPLQLRYNQPVIAKGEHYYVRVSSNYGNPFYDVYAKDIMCAAFNLHKANGYGNTPSHEIVQYIYRTSIFFSKTGTVTNLHYDESGKGAVLCQIKGRKRVMLWEPGDENMHNFPINHPYYRRSKFNKRDPHKQNRNIAEKIKFDMVVTEGLCIFIPVGWWHYIESLDEDTISIRFTIEYENTTMAEVIESGGP